MSPGVTTDAAPPTVARPTLAPGTLVAGRYRLEARLGAGGGGTVWRCFDDKLASVVALKILSGDGDVERWRREVAIARRIAHRNVCRVHDLGEDGDLRFVTMELVEGESLRTRIRPDLPAEQARDLALQIVAGTAAIHAAGVVHRDLKPENVVVATDGRAVIVDFGLAREPRLVTATTPQLPPSSPGSDNVETVRDQGPVPMPVAMPVPQTITNVGFAVGTPRYMAPEQAAGMTVDGRADVWALGLVLHELLAGAMPEAVPQGRRVASPGSAGARSIAEGRCGVSIDPRVDDKWPGASEILRRCLAIEPAVRFPDARALYAALAAKRRRRWPIALAGVALAGGAAAGAVALARSSDDTPAIVEKSTQPPGPYRILQVTTTDASWPGGAPQSVALTPDAARFAYTTGDGKLYVRDLGGGETQAWSSPKVHSTDRLEDGKDLFVATWAAGWFSDGTIAELGSTWRGDWLIVRTARDGTYTQLYKHPQRFTAAVSSKDRVAIGIDDYALFTLAPGDAAPTQIATVGRGEQVMALAWSPDGSRLAVARMAASGDNAIVQIMSATGTEIREIWRGPTALTVDTLLAWMGDDRIAFDYQDPATRKTALAAIDVATRAVTVRQTFDDYVGNGSGARGTALVLRGTARHTVQLLDKLHRFTPLHDASVQAGALAGWTPDGRVVFAMGQPGKLQIVRASPGGTPEPWPGAIIGDRPDSVVDDSLIIHHADGNAIAIERLSPTGERKPLGKVTAGLLDGVVRCAGNRAPPCVLVETTDPVVRIIPFDPQTGDQRNPLHERPVREKYMRDVALSGDGSLLAIVDGGDQVTVIDVASGRAERPPSAGNGAALQTVAFGTNDELWFTSIGLRGHLFGLATFSRSRDAGDAEKNHYLPLPMSRAPYRDAMRLYSNPRPSPDGSKVAVGVREFHMDVWRADGL